MSEKTEHDKMFNKLKIKKRKQIVIFRNPVKKNNWIQKMIKNEH